ncbi:FAD-dependent oxidoreductase [Anaerocolumna sp. MB42-C2]|uniref:FAD-dependent oxidoreductase n=1 Tax=Anaerocolumna sp. MB42-C2 TaxID=3070997 RepID=UPI0027DEE594|nr:FAD-dependent oxidoreductase [Anaerocolumna sp. MB42-C2]WMJ90114.1 FAD-dependent oxidoreductase [Anaerocolumna sp. MB42-C2]
MAIITIDGISLNVPDNKNVLDCALDAGIYIPHLCHHPNLSELGSCRMCIVEVEGEQGIVTSCTLKAKDGMKIRTNSQEITRLRKLAMELLLTGHPEDCTTCPKYGQCELQALIQYIGPKTGRLKMRTKGFQAEERNPLLIHDMNRCVLCGRCVRACNELRGVKVLQYRKKELESYVGTLHNQLLIDSDCRFCGACAEVCPTGTIRDKLQLSASNTSREDTLVPCKYACPAHTDIPRYVRYVKDGKYDEATAVIREKVPFPKTLGYICSHACEQECNRKELNEPMSIRNLKRYAAEHDTGLYWKGKGKQLENTGKKVCVIGAGPAGLTAAYYLRKQGHEVTIKEALPEAGGMIRYGIPAYRLPRSIIEEEISVIKEAGVQITTNARIEKITELLKEYDAVLTAIGNHSGVRLPMDGNDLPEVLLNVDFLRNASMGKYTGIGSKVIVLGGGNVAFDCARTARRLGALEVHLACLESADNMTADQEEILQAKEEGILIHPGQTFEKITGTDHVTGIDFMNVESFTFDENKRPMIQKEKNSEHHIDADTVIFAVGQRPGIIPEAGLPLRKGNLIIVKDNSTATGVNGIFAAGDGIYGTKSVIMAVASGRSAAIEIDRYLGGDGDITEILAPSDNVKPYIGQFKEFGYQSRKHSSVLAPEERKDNFNLVDLGLETGEVCGEAGRCLQCDLRLKIEKPRLWGDFNSKEVNQP